MEPITLTFPRQMRLTDDEFFEFCRANEELKMERTKTGKIIIMSPTGGNMGIKNSELVAELIFWNRRAQTGLVFDSSTGFRLPNGSVRSPDVAWLRNERWQSLSEEDKEKFPPLCPDFIIELQSTSDESMTLQEKMQEWMDSGCKLAWLIDPKRQKAFIYRSSTAAPEEKDFSAILFGEDILPGFELDLKQLV